MSRFKSFMKKSPTPRAMRNIMPDSIKAMRKDTLEIFFIVLLENCNPKSMRKYPEPTDRKSQRELICPTLINFFTMYPSK